MQKTASMKHIAVPQEEDRAMATDIMLRKFYIVDMLVGRPDLQANTVITILHSHTTGRAGIVSLSLHGSVVPVLTYL